MESWPGIDPGHPRRTKTAAPLERSARPARKHRHSPRVRDINEAVPLGVWPWLFAAGLAFFLVVEAEKLVIRSSAWLRRMVTAVEAGAKLRQMTSA